jgi:hypothetical protein
MCGEGRTRSQREHEPTDLGFGQTRGRNHCAKRNSTGARMKILVFAPMLFLCTAGAFAAPPSGFDGRMEPPNISRGARYTIQVRAKSR